MRKIYFAHYFALFLHSSPNHLSGSPERPFAALHTPGGLPVVTGSQVDENLSRSHSGVPGVSRYQVQKRCKFHTKFKK